MKRKSLLILISSLMGLCCLASLVGTVAYYLLARPGREARPVVLIKAPRYGEQVDANALTLVRAMARDPTGVIRVELWVDGELVALEESQLPKGHNPFPFFEGWQPDSPGRHTLIVRAYNSARRSGQAAVIVEALDLPKPEPTPEAHQVQEGDTLESIAADYRVSVEDIVEHNPGLEEPLKPGETILVPPLTPEDEDIPPELLPPEPPPEPLPGEEAPDLEEAPPRLIFERPPLIAYPMLRLIFERPPLIAYPMPPSIPLVVEALSLEVNRVYDEVYCYVSLAGSDMERVPDTGGFDAMGENYWNIAALLGGENRRTVSVPEEEGRLDVRLNCLGYEESDEGGQAFDLGTLEASHFQEEWDGRPIEQEVTGPDGWFRVAYRICPIDGCPEEIWPIEDLPRPINLEETMIWLMGEGVSLYGFNFEYPTGAEERIDGYLLFRDDALLTQVEVDNLWHKYTLPDYSGYFLRIPKADFYPPCPHTYTFYMKAYRDDPEKGRIESPPSNSVFTEGDPTPCYEAKVVMVTFEQLWVYCLNVDNPPPEFPVTIDMEGRFVFDEETGEGLGCADNGYDPRPRQGWHGRIWVNDERVVHMEGGNIDGATKYQLPNRTLNVREDEISKELILWPFDDLTIMMKFWDHDFWTDDDGFCHGEYTISARELYEIANLPPGQRKRTYEPEFASAGGNCFLKFTVEVLATWEAEE
jgi:LysM repeat protein